MPKVDPALLAVTVFGIVVLGVAVVIDVTLNAKDRRTVHTMRAAGWAYAMPWIAIGVGFLLLRDLSTLGLLIGIAGIIRSWYLRSHAGDYLPNWARPPLPQPVPGYAPPPPPADQPVPGYAQPPPPAGQPMPGYAPPSARW